MHYRPATDHANWTIKKGAQMSEYHVPVMLSECIEALDIKPNGVYVDVTYGGGGHSREILNKLGSKGKLVAFDQSSLIITHETAKCDQKLESFHRKLEKKKNCPTWKPKK